MELRIHPASHVAELRVFSPRIYTMVSLSFDVCSFVGGTLFRPLNGSKQQSQSNTFTVAVVVVALGRSLYFLSQPPPNLLAQLLL